MCANVWPLLNPRSEAVRRKIGFTHWAAFNCIMDTAVKILVAGNCFLRKEDRDRALRLGYKEHLELD